MINYAKDRWKELNSIVNGKGRFYKDHYKLLLSWCSREINMVRSLPVPEDGIQRLKELN